MFHLTKKKKDIEIKIIRIPAFRNRLEE